MLFEFEVSEMVPWLKFGEMAETIVPKPICRGFVPPLVVVGLEPKLCVAKNCVANVAVEALNPTVLELARLLPTTSIVVSAADMPVKAVLIADAKPIVYLLMK
jgi:hypothetical protein